MSHLICTIAYLNSYESFFYPGTGNSNDNCHRVIALFPISPNFSLYFCVALNFRQSKHSDDRRVEGCCSLFTYSRLFSSTSSQNMYIRFMKYSQKVYTSVKVNSNWTTRQTVGRFYSVNMYFYYDVSYTIFQVMKFDIIHNHKLLKYLNLHHSTRHRHDGVANDVTRRV